MKTQLLQLQAQRDSLRAKTQAMSRLGLFGKEFDEQMATLRHLDGLFFRLIKTTDLTLSKHGRLA